MRKTQEFLKNFVGTNDEVGVKIGQWLMSDSRLLQKVVLPLNTYPKNKYEEIKKLLDKFCPGVNEEISSFSKTIGIKPEQALFYAMTYLERGCSLMALKPDKTADGHVLMGRNYDFNDEMEEMCFAYTAIKGKYRYIGSTLNLFGRSDGMNEHGLAVCKASNGLPVGNFEGGQTAGVTGFSFWIVIRSILENCKNVEDAITWTMQAPIGYNLNLMLADKSGKIALVQCINGQKEYKLLGEKDNENYLSCTNHTLLEKIKPYEKILIENSVIRNNSIYNLFSTNKLISKKEIKALLSTSYPEGLCCYYYKEYFGTLRSMIFDLTEGLIEVAFGSPNENQWRTFAVEPLNEQVLEVMVLDQQAPKEFYKTI